MVFKKNFIILLLLLLSFVSCLQTKTITKKNNVKEYPVEKLIKNKSKSKNCYFPRSNKLAPDWVCPKTRDKNKYLGVGSCRSDNKTINETKKCAQLEAVKDLAERTNVLMKHFLKDYISLDNNILTERIQSYTYQSSEINIDYYVVLDETQNDIEDGTKEIHILVGVSNEPEKIIEFMKSITGKEIWEFLSSEVTVDKIVAEIAQRDLDLQEQIKINKLVLKNIKDTQTDIQKSTYKNRQELTSIAKQYTQTIETISNNNISISNTYNNKLDTLEDVFKKNDINLKEITNNIQNIQVKIHNQVNNNSQKIADISKQYTQIENSVKNNIKSTLKDYIKIDDEALRKINEQYITLNESVTKHFNEQKKFNEKQKTTNSFLPCFFLKSILQERLRYKSNVSEENRIWNYSLSEHSGLISGAICGDDSKCYDKINLLIERCDIPNKDLIKKFYIDQEKEDNND